ncbi:MAG: ATP-grasp domain-containing protein [Candidatus Aureabacteria bacterium]|nr:ATP-grasp domain-containing protein [Candidatus Auribacterota bacterium]
MKHKLKVILLFSMAVPPPPDNDFSKWLDDKGNEDWDAERDVFQALNRLGHEVKMLGIHDDLNPLIKTVKEYKPDVVFNLVEYFLDNDIYDKNITGILELLEVPYTGSDSTALAVCRNKDLTKKILKFHRIKVPSFTVFARNKRIRRSKHFHFPMIVKPLKEDASVGIARSSFVENDKDLEERVRYIHESLKMDAIVEEYIDGRELYVSVLGNDRLQVLPVREMIFGQVPQDEPRVATYKAKWDDEYRKKWGISNVFADRLQDGTNKTLEIICKKAYRSLMLKGYGRFDIRMRENKEIFIIEANPNPLLAHNDEVAQSAEKIDISYDNLIQKILTFAMRDNGFEGRS